MVIGYFSKSTEIARKVRFLNQLRFAFILNPMYSGSEGVQAVRTFTPKSWLLEESGEIQLAHRVAVFDGLSGWKGDPVIEILVDGKSVFLDKAKRDEAEELGVENDNGSHSIDHLWLDEVMS